MPSGRAGARSVSTKTTSSAPRRSTSIAASPSEARTARARSSIAPPYRQVRSSRTTGEVVGTPSSGGPATAPSALVMSASTAPASTEDSWSGSPTSSSRASERTASSSRAIKVSETIDISSTTTTSYGSRLSAWWRKRPRVPGSQPSSRCRVTADRSATRATSSGASRFRASASASDSRAAALPVGAANAIRGARPGWSPSMASTLATVVVFPVPGPPASTVTHCRALTSAARR